MSLKELLSQRAAYEAQITDIQGHINAINIDIEHILAGKLADLRKLQAKEFGAVNLVVDGFKVTETVPKKVEWDQDKMTNLFEAILKAGDVPFNYMRVKLEVPEKMYEGFVPEVKNMFSDCRTVKPGRPSIKFEEVA